MKHVSHYGRLGKHTAAGVGDVEVRFDFQEQIALAHALTFLNGKFRNSAAHLWADFDERDRLNFASGDDLILVEPPPTAPRPPRRATGERATSGGRTVDPRAVRRRGSDARLRKRPDRLTRPSAPRETPATAPAGEVRTEVVAGSAISDRLLPAGSGRTAKPTQACNSHQNDACQPLMNGENHA